MTDKRYEREARRRLAIQHLRILRNAGRSDPWIVDKLGLRTTDALRKWEATTSPQPRTCEALARLAAREGAR